MAMTLCSQSCGTHLVLCLRLQVLFSSFKNLLAVSIRCIQHFRFASMIYTHLQSLSIYQTLVDSCRAILLTIPCSSFPAHLPASTGTSHSVLYPEGAMSVYILCIIERPTSSQTLSHVARHSSSTLSIYMSLSCSQLYPVHATDGSQ
ncbi:hypothetical protein NEOLEDRAFT_724189 [Neolentinus lepideus HHB14362 ss-1]|uniref:Uncharacterized protein n=1 Tax=Neolentinus lepideus HHB14362 ss-1 TaxID=1314782 RepID=A0A165Q3E9_9AGAM|nr:hypothetical protein NEOLEDRAFT_724189 [Neolentinus lepideus HHB14362 ss-1]